MNKPVDPDQLFDTLVKWLPPAVAADNTGKIAGHAPERCRLTPTTGCHGQRTRRGAQARRRPTAQAAFVVLSEYFPPLLDALRSVLPEA